MSIAEKPVTAHVAPHADSKLRAEAFDADARVVQAKEMLAAAAREHRAQLTVTQPADPERAALLRDELERFAELRGYKGQGYRGLTLDSLLQLDSAIVPIVQYGNPHFVVVRGLDRRGRLKLADPGFGNRTMSVEDFTAVWRDRIGFVVTR